MKNIATKAQLNLFNGIYIPADIKRMDFATTNKRAISSGYLLHPDQCIQEVVDWVQTNSFNPNATFFKNCKEVASMDRSEIWQHQILNYITNFFNRIDENIEVYVPNKSGEDIPLSSFKTILIFNKQTLLEKVEAMIYSGVALKQDTITDLVLVIKTFKLNIDNSKIKNKEILMFLHKENNTIPLDPIEFIRFLVFLKTDKTLLINDKKTLDAIKANKSSVGNYIIKYGLHEVSEHFFRFKKIFLAMKSSKDDTPIINKLRRLATYNHKPMQKNPINNVFALGTSDLIEVLKNTNNFKLCSLLHTASVRTLDLQLKPFLIRNGKMFCKNEPITGNNKATITKHTIFNTLVENLIKKVNGTIILPSTIQLTIPTSEKNFIGDVPYGSYIELDNSNLIVGVNRTAEHCEAWLDLSATTPDGSIINWNNSFKDANVLYSGDINLPTGTSEVSELMYVDKLDQLETSYIFKANDFLDEKMPFTFFLAKEDAKNKMTNNYFCDPNNIFFKLPRVADGETVLGVLEPAKKLFRFVSFKSSDRKIAGQSITNLYSQYICDISDSYTTIKSILDVAGIAYTISDDKAAIADYNLNNKSDIIKLFS